MSITGPGWDFLRMAVSTYREYFTGGEFMSIGVHEQFFQLISHFWKGIIFLFGIGMADSLCHKKANQ
jgi:hypothetical protein